MKKKSFIYILASFLFVACNTKVDNKVNLESLVPYDSLSTEIDAPTLIQCSDGLLFINGTYGDKGMVSLIDVKDDSLLCTFARKGQGGDELLQIVSMDVFDEGGKKYIELFDNLQRKLFVYSVDSIIGSDGISGLEYIKKADDNLRLLEMYKLNHQRYISTGRLSTKFALLDDSLKIKRTMGAYLSDNTSSTDTMIISKANYGRLYLSPDRKKMVSVVFMAGILTFYDIEEDNINKKWDYKIHDLEYRVDEKAILPTQPMGYLAGGVLDDKVIGLYSGEKKEGGTNYAKEFHIFDMNGNLLKKYKVDHSLYNFCIDSSSGLIYAIAYEPETKILVYKMD